MDIVPPADNADLRHTLMVDKTGPVVTPCSRRKKPWTSPDDLIWKTVQQKVRRLQKRIASHRPGMAKDDCAAGPKGTKLDAECNAVKLKKSGKLRPLGIPTMHDRAMQALCTLALIPISETLGDTYSYGFRQGRCCADALRHCFDRFCQTTSPEWILEADIAGCFYNISHQWILVNIPVDKKILGQWLNAGFLDKGELFPTLKGTPQGIISPVLPRGMYPEQRVAEE